MRKAADQDDAYAQAWIGVMYMAGHGVPHDRVLAYMWLSLAAAQGGDPLAAEGRDAFDSRTKQARKIYKHIFNVQ
jgi:uncharacterized protein